jgi:prepilin-type N-terminal cleavage/methylation domain-containing protein
MKTGKRANEKARSGADLQSAVSPSCPPSAVMLRRTGTRLGLRFLQRHSSLRRFAECNSAIQQIANLRHFDSSGFTLIEVVISTALMALTIVAAYLCFSASLSTQKALEPRLEVIQNARVAMALLAADLRSACPLDKDTPFLGIHRELASTVADSIDFATHNYTPKNPREGDFCETSFYLQEDPETGRFSLWRRRNPTIAPDPFSGGYREEIATGVLGLGFEYYDGLDWYSSWGEMNGAKAQTSQKDRPNLSGMPEAVRITIWFDANPHGKKVETREENEKPEPPLVFQTIARVNLAAASQSSGSSSSSGTSSPGTSDASGQVLQGTPGEGGPY